MDVQSSEELPPIHYLSSHIKISKQLEYSRCGTRGCKPFAVFARIYTDFTFSCNSSIVSAVVWNQDFWITIKLLTLRFKPIFLHTIKVLPCAVNLHSAPFLLYDSHLLACFWLVQVRCSRSNTTDLRHTRTRTRRQAIGSMHLRTTRLHITLLCILHHRRLILNRIQRTLSPILLSITTREHTTTRLRQAQVSLVCATSNWLIPTAKPVM